MKVKVRSVSAATMVADTVLVASRPMEPRVRRRRQFWRAVLFHAMVIAGAIVMLYPIVWLLASSLKPRNEIWTTVASIIPEHFTLEHYIQGWQGFGGVTFTIFYLNTFLYAGLGTVFTILVSSLTAFGFARVNFPGSRLWFGVMLLTLMIPVQIQIIPQYILFNKLHMVNTFYPLLLPRLLGQAGQAFFIFMIVQFIRGIPIELDEAAEIDGCNKFRIFGQIMFVTDWLMCTCTI